MNNFVFAKTMKIIRNYRDIKIVTTDQKRNKLVSDPKYHKIKGVSEKLLPTEIKKTKVELNMPVHLGMSISDLSKIVM